MGEHRPTDCSQLSGDGVGIPRGEGDDAAAASSSRELGAQGACRLGCLARGVEAVRRYAYHAQKLLVFIEEHAEGPYVARHQSVDT